MEKRQDDVDVIRDLGVTMMPQHTQLQQKEILG